jgi:hypothetical protein
MAPALLILNHARLREGGFADGFEQVELTEPKKAIEQKG